MTDTLKQWLKLSRGDYKSAIKLLANDTDDDDECYPNVCFNAQQCIEKLMKAVLILHEQEVPKTHDLNKLQELIKPWIVLDISHLNLLFLTQGAVKLRYPIDHPTEASTHLAVKLCEALRAQLLPLFDETAE